MPYTHVWLLALCVCVAWAVPQPPSPPPTTKLPQWRFANVADVPVLFSLGPTISQEIDVGDFTTYNAPTGVPVKSSLVVYDYSTFNALVTENVYINNYNTYTYILTGDASAGYSVVAFSVDVGNGTAQPFNGMSALTMICGSDVYESVTVNVGGVSMGGVSLIDNPLQATLHVPAGSYNATVSATRSTDSHSSVAHTTPLPLVIGSGMRYSLLVWGSGAAPNATLVADNSEQATLTMLTAGVRAVNLDSSASTVVLSAAASPLLHVEAGDVTGYSLTAPGVVELSLDNSTKTHAWLQAGYYYTVFIQGSELSVVGDTHAAFSGASQMGVRLINLAGPELSLQLTTGTSSSSTSGSSSSSSSSTSSSSTSASGGSTLCSVSGGGLPGATSSVEYTAPYSQLGTLNATNTVTGNSKILPVGLQHMQGRYTLFVYESKSGDVEVKIAQDSGPGAPSILPPYNPRATTSSGSGHNKPGKVKSWLRWGVPVIVLGAIVLVVGLYLVVRRARGPSGDYTALPTNPNFDIEYVEGPPLRKKKLPKEKFYV